MISEPVLPVTSDPGTVSVIIDLAALSANIAAVADLVAPAQVMVVVKADGYGHGLRGVAAAARAAGICWLGVAVPGEARALRAAGDTGRVLCWLYGPDEDLGDLVAADVDLSVSGLGELERIVAAAGRVGSTARVHLKIDTGLTRNGVPAADWARVCRAAVQAREEGAIEVVGIWSHLATAEEPAHPATQAQQRQFAEAVTQARALGLWPTLLHLANSAAALGVPAARHDLVRLGIAAYGVDPAGDVARRAGITLRPVMSVTAALVRVVAVEAGTGVSYGHTWVAPTDTVVALVPIGYADGLLRQAGNTATMRLNGRDVPIVGRVCMDQCVVELGAGATDRVGDRVVLFGAGGQSANELGAACGTLGYEIITRIGPRLPRVLVEGLP